MQHATSEQFREQEPPSLGGAETKMVLRGQLLLPCFCRRCLIEMGICLTIWFGQSASIATRYRLRQFDKFDNTWQHFDRMLRAE